MGYDIVLSTLFVTSVHPSWEFLPYLIAWYLLTWFPAAWGWWEDLVISCSVMSKFKKASRTMLQLCKWFFAFFSF